jgi:type II secretory pathway pseudopilin PulG
MGQCSCEHPSRIASLGFAYLWLLFAIAVIGLSLSLASEVYVISLQREKEKELLAIGRQFRQAIGHYYETKTQGNRSEYPSSLDDLLLDPRSLTPKRHLRKIFVDPITGKAGWGLFKVGGRVAGVYSLSEKVPIKQAGFEADDAVFAGKKKYSEWVFTYPADLVNRPTANNTPSTVSVPATPISSPVIGEVAPPPVINSQ